MKRKNIIIFQYSEKQKSGNNSCLYRQTLLHSSRFTYACVLIWQKCSFNSLTNYGNYYLNVFFHGI